MSAPNTQDNQLANEYFIDEILLVAIKEGASDVHLSTGTPPISRVTGTLKPLKNFRALTPDDMKNFIAQLLTDEQIEKLYNEKDLDTSYELNNKERFRVNVYFERGNLGLAFRLIPPYIPSLQDLNLPPLLYDFCKKPQGLILVTGASGVGKSTTIATLLNWINQNRNTHIVTIEDPIEYLFRSDKSLIHQRELNIDTSDWIKAMRSSLREDVDVLLVGETRDFETLQFALKAAETGHLVFTTLHAYSASQAIERVISMFPETKQDQARMQLSMVLEGILTQTLVKGIDESKRYPAIEILIGTDAVKNTIREGNTHYIDNIITTALDTGMISMERSLADLVNEGLVSIEEGASHAKRPEEFVRFLKKDVRKKAS